MTELRCTCCGQALPDLNGITADLERGEIRFRGLAVQVTRKEFDIFAALQKATGRTLSKEVLLTQLYDLEVDEPDMKIIDVFVCKLRKKVARIGIEIGTNWGRGYFLIEPKPLEGSIAA